MAYVYVMHVIHNVNCVSRFVNRLEPKVVTCCITACVPTRFVNLLLGDGAESATWQEAGDKEQAGEWTWSRWDADLLESHTIAPCVCVLICLCLLLRIKW